MRVRGAIICSAVVLVASVGSAPAWAKKNSLGVHLSVAGSEPTGWSAPWEKEGVTLNSSLQFATSGGEVECVTEAPGDVGNGGEYESPRTATVSVKTTSESCNSTMSDAASPTIEGNDGGPIIWWVLLRGSGAATVCTNFFVGYGGPCSSIGSSVVTVMSGTTLCTYEYHHGKEASGMFGSFVPAALGGAEAQPIEITLPAQQFELTRTESKSSEYSACPATGELSAHFKLESEHDGPVLAHVVEPHQELLVTPRNERGRPRPGTAKTDPCKSLAKLELPTAPCTVHLTNGDKAESVEVREIFFEKEADGAFKLLPTEHECVGRAGENGVVLAPGQTCNLVIEETKLSSSDLYIFTESQPGGVPDGEYFLL